MKGLTCYTYRINNTGVLISLGLLFFATVVVLPDEKEYYLRRYSTTSSMKVNAIEGRIWDRKIARHSKYVASSEETLKGINWNQVGDKYMFDKFEPEWNCEDEVRLGSDIVSIGDGPKFACGSSLLASLAGECIVYSIGSSYDFSFEYAVNRIAPKCEIHTFDGTLDLDKKALPDDLTYKNIHFHHWNTVTDCVANDRSMCVVESLQKLNHTGKTITWLKTDCEGCEFSVITEFLSAVNIDQIMVEIHNYGNGTKIAELFHTFRKAGMMVFHKERNSWGCNGYLCVEYALISKRYARQVLKKYLQ